MDTEQLEEAIDQLQLEMLTIQEKLDALMFHFRIGDQQELALEESE